MTHRGNKELLNSLTSSISSDFYRDVVSGLNEAHREAWKHVEQIFSQPVAKDLVPHYRRALFEDKMGEIARKHGLNSKPVLNKTKNASHVELELNLESKKVILTALAVQDAYDFTRLKTAQFRKTLAQESCLFKEFEISGDAYYGVILHGANTENRDKLDFAYLAFPYADCKGWFGKYNLFLMASSTENAETIIDNAVPSLRSDAVKKAE
jgi:hypothetical protein